MRDFYIRRIASRRPLLPSLPFQLFNSVAAAKIFPCPPPPAQVSPALPWGSTSPGYNSPAAAENKQRVAMNCEQSFPKGTEATWHPSALISRHRLHK